MTPLAEAQDILGEAQRLSVAPSVFDVPGLNDWARRLTETIAMMHKAKRMIETEAEKLRRET